MEKQYRFIGIDEGKQNLFLGDTEQNAPLWIQSLEKYPTARALQNLGNNRILAGFENGYFEFDSRDGTILHECPLWSGVTSVCRLENGQTLITLMDSEDVPGVGVLTLDCNDKIIKQVTKEWDYVRLMSLSEEGTWLLSLNDHIGETDQELRIRHRFSAEGFLHAWQSRRLNDGNILISAGYGAFMALFSPEGTPLNKFGTADQLPPEVSPFFYASFQHDSEDNLLVANWQGHGPDNGDKGVQLLQFSAEGRYLRGWSFPLYVSSLQGLLLIGER